MNVRELIISERLPDVFLDQLCRFWELLTAELLDDCLDLGFRRLTALLRVDGFEHMGDIPNLGRGNFVEDVPVKMHRATLPTSIGQILPNALNQTPAGIRDNQLDPFQAAINQMTKEPRPTRQDRRGR